MSRRRLILKSCIIFLLLTIDNVVNMTSTITRNSDLYDDTESDQTTNFVQLTPKEKLEMELEILKLLGLSNKPKNTTRKALSMEGSARKFILNLYENTLEDRIRLKRNKTEFIEFNLKEEDLRAIDECDIITFTAQQNHQGAGGKPDRVKRMWFDVSGIPEDEKIRSAELRLYRGPDTKNVQSRGAFVIKVYRVLGKKNGKKEMQLVDSINTTAGQEGWITANVTESLEHWMKNPADNKGFYLLAQPINGSSNKSRLEDIGVIGFRDDTERQPFMVGYFKNTGLRQSTVNRPIRENDFDIIRNRRTDYSSARDLFKKTNSNDAVIDSMEHCKMHALHVSFKDLGWQEWIIAPEGYDPGYCDGNCNFPLRDNMKATNHAVIQTYIHLLNPKTVPRVCCIPSKLSAISVLYLLDNNSVILKKFNNMVVRDCGCH